MYFTCTYIVYLCIIITFALTLSPKHQRDFPIKVGTSVFVLSSVESRNLISACLCLHEFSWRRGWICWHSSIHGSEDEVEDEVERKNAVWLACVALACICAPFTHVCDKRMTRSEKNSHSLEIKRIVIFGGCDFMFLSKKACVIMPEGLYLHIRDRQ